MLQRLRFRLERLWLWRILSCLFRGHDFSVALPFDPAEHLPDDPSPPIDGHQGWADARSGTASCRCGARCGVRVRRHFWGELGAWVVWVDVGRTTTRARKTDLAKYLESSVSPFSEERELRLHE